MKYVRYIKRIQKPTRWGKGARQRQWSCRRADYARPRSGTNYGSPETYPAVNVAVEYLRRQRVLRSVFALAVGLHVRLLVLLARLRDVHHVVRYALAVQYHGHPLLAFLHLGHKKKPGSPPARRQTSCPAYALSSRGKRNTYLLVARNAGHVHFHHHFRNANGN